MLVVVVVTAVVAGMTTNLTSFIKFVDKFINPLIWISIVLLFVEFFTGSNNSLDSGMVWFLWIERITAAIFMTEYFCRWYEDHNDESESIDNDTIDIGHHYYPFSIMGVVDLLAWLPFLLGFFLPVHLLGWIRALRILRVFKLFRYHRSLQLFALAMYKSWWFIRAILFVTFCFGLLSVALIYEAEKTAQPESFGRIQNLFWFVIVSDTTVGYGDMSPVTPIGRILTTIVLFIPGIAVFGALLGVISNSLSEVMEMERDPDIDPIEEFKKEYLLRRERIT